MLSIFTAPGEGVMKALVKRGIKPGDTVVLVIPRGARDSVAGVMKTIETLLSTVSKPNIAILEVNIEDFTASVSAIRRFIIEKGGPVYANLSAGPLILAIETLTAVITSGVDAEIELEAGGSTISFRAWDLHPITLDTIDIEILRKAKGGITLPDLARELGMPKSSVWRRITSLERFGLVQTSRKGRRLWVSITNRGLLYT